MLYCYLFYDFRTKVKVGSGASGMQTNTASDNYLDGICAMSIDIRY